MSEVFMNSDMLNEVKVLVEHLTDNYTYGIYVDARVTDSKDSLLGLVKYHEEEETYVFYPRESTSPTTVCNHNSLEKGEFCSNCTHMQR